ncbi:TetR-like C-terminal domain-containing protein [Clostridium sp. HBUAS56017]|uniref:TetR/AcrR family transcriptional regulator C-terminal domain-containing protein n=2 Tax=Clostridium cibarium TaxID=2762247 RepID=A0ABR8PQX1_9CLOT|nr:TetR-like C-terminal domain-containing protein [Clostridium sp. HBUAS56017]MBD7910576.1 TetR/AcrR family transcriptional regulator C-terminal domain-containing protein [Clostridium cibarium]
MKENLISKITVKMVTDTCGVSRHTFYNHFHDVYDLLEWIFENEVIDELDECCNLSNWKNGVCLVLRYTLDNKSICINTCKSLGRELLEVFLQKTFHKVLIGVIAEITQNMDVDEKIKNQVATFFAYAITGEFLHWINSGLIEKKEDIADRIEIMLDGTILRIMTTNKK